MRKSRRASRRIFQLLILVNAAGNQSVIDRKGGRAFVEDMQAYFADENPIERDGIAVRQLRALREHQGPRDKKPRLSDVKEMFLEMKKISRVK